MRTEWKMRAVHCLTFGSSQEREKRIEWDWLLHRSQVHYYGEWPVDRKIGLIVTYSPQALPIKRRRGWDIVGEQIKLFFNSSREENMNIRESPEANSTNKQQAGRSFVE